MLSEFNKTGQLPLRSRKGLTLIELLVVIAILSLLVQLLLPAVQAARERARQTTCLNHLRQLALASQMHTDAHGFLPSGGWSDEFVADPNRGYGKQQPGSWLFGLLPYVELGQLRTNAEGDDLLAKQLPAATRALHTSSPEVFYCPSRRSAQAYPYKSRGNGSWSLKVGQSILQLAGVTKSDYAANSGDALRSAAKTFSNEGHMATPDSYESLRPNFHWTEVDPKNWTGE